MRVKGQGLLRKITKSKASQRELGLPNWALAVLRARFAAGIRLDEPIFADAIAGFRDPSNVRRSLREALSPVGSAARRDLGLSLRAARRETGMTRKEVARALSWPESKIELIETGRIKVDRQLATPLLRTYDIQLEESAALLSQVDKAAKPVPADALAWITSHAFRKTTATVLDDGQTARQIADHLGHARVSMTQDTYLTAVPTPTPAWPGYHASTMPATWQSGAAHAVFLGLPLSTGRLAYPSPPVVRAAGSACAA